MLNTYLYYNSLRSECKNTTRYVDIINTKPKMYVTSKKRGHQCFYFGLFLGFCDNTNYEKRQTNVSPPAAR